LPNISDNTDFLQNIQIVSFCGCLDRHLHYCWSAQERHFLLTECLRKTTGDSYSALFRSDEWRMVSCRLLCINLLARCTGSTSIWSSV